MAERDLRMLDVYPEGDLPAAIAEASFNLFGVPLRCYVLDNGQRIVDADDVAALFDAMANGDGSEPSNDGLDKLAKWLKGIE